MYVNRKIRLERIPVLVERGLEQLEYQEKHIRNSDAFPNREGGAIEDNNSDTKSRAREVLIRHAMVTGQMERTRALLNDLRHQLDQSRSSDSGGSVAAAWRRDQAIYDILSMQAGINVPLGSEL